MLEALALPLPIPATSSMAPGRVPWRRVAGDIPAALGVLTATLLLLIVTGFIAS